MRRAWLLIAATVEQCPRHSEKQALTRSDTWLHTVVPEGQKEDLFGGTREERVSTVHPWWTLLLSGPLRALHFRVTRGVEVGRPGSTRVMTGRLDHTLRPVASGRSTLQRHSRHVVKRGRPRVRRAVTGALDRTLRPFGPPVEAPSRGPRCAGPHLFCLCVVHRTC